MPTELTTASRILIARGGTWAVCTAIRLARRGYIDVTIFDTYSIPSPISAGNDINKIVEEGSFLEDEDDISMISTKQPGVGCHDTIFKPYYHPSGYIVAADISAALEQLEKRETPNSRIGFVTLNIAGEFRKTMLPGALTGDFPGWKGVFKSSDAGWVHARKAVKSFVTSLIFGDRDVLGIKTADGKEHRGDRAILAADAGADALF
ncbi:cdc73eb1-2fa9-4dba-8156-db2da58834a3 [Sclerotinia trifoliorum]|uniref:Cdc73eb1-2fa9-4dba-8156-db2da58834a3 n=1 Tax=Sclerotinia trifoliorum TaxID=28548 RepID=A0A8H2ZTA7_9HELO|nr:cdc73eb1-2fa9-4dba-8156-db2da58834a3 [Sclerotinia trifoliorum]